MSIGNRREYPQWLKEQGNSLQSDRLWYLRHVYLRGSIGKLIASDLSNHNFKSTQQYSLKMLRLLSTCQLELQIQYWLRPFHDLGYTYQDNRIFIEYGLLAKISEFGFNKNYGNILRIQFECVKTKRTFDFVIKT